MTIPYLGWSANKIIPFFFLKKKNFSFFPDPALEEGE